MIKKEISEREPYHLYIRFDMNAEAKDIEEARAIVKSWIVENVEPRVREKTSVKSLKVLQPTEVYMPKLE